MAQLGKCLLHKHKVLNWIPQHFCKAGCGSTYLQSQQRGWEGEQKIPGACWTASLTKISELQVHLKTLSQKKNNNNKVKSN